MKNIKNIITVFIISLLSINIFGQTEKLNQLFDQYQEREGVTSIKISKPMFRLLGSVNIDDADLQKIKPLINKMNGIKILIIEKPETQKNPTTTDLKLAENAKSLQNEILSAIKNLKYEELMTVNSKDNNIKFLAQNTAAEILDNMVLNIQSQGNNVLMMLDGKISMDDVSKLINETQKNMLEPTTYQNSFSENSTTISESAQLRNVEDFNGIKASVGISVFFTQANQQTVKVNTDPGKEQYVVTKVENGILKITIDTKGIRNLNLRKIQVFVSAPHLISVDLSSGASLKTENTVQEKLLVLDLSSGSSLKGDFKIATSSSFDLSSGAILKMNLETQNITVDSSSGSSFTLFGKADLANFDLSSGANCNADQFETNSIILDASSGANAKVFAKENLNASVSSAASVGYAGNPKNVVSNVKKITGATLKKID